LLMMILGKITYTSVRYILIQSVFMTLGY
jgi:hypothetical protein